MRLVDCFVGLIAYVAYFLETVSEEQPAFESVQRDIDRLISQSENALKGQEISKAEYDMARFAVFAWVDEAILSSKWNERARWQGLQLQLRYYQTTDAGEIFFERLNQIELHHRQVREVYYLCLAMGFVGRYCRDGDEYLLEQLRVSNLKVLLGSSMALPTLDAGEIFPEAYPVELPRERSEKWYDRISMLTVALLGLPLFVYLTAFAIYMIVLENYGQVPGGS